MLSLWILINTLFLFSERGIPFKMGICWMHFWSPKAPKATTVASKWQCTCKLFQTGRESNSSAIAIRAVASTSCADWQGPMSCRIVPVQLHILSRKIFQRCAAHRSPQKPSRVLAYWPCRTNLWRYGKRCFPEHMLVQHNMPFMHKDALAESR